MKKYFNVLLPVVCAAAVSSSAFAGKPVTTVYTVTAAESTVDKMNTTITINLADAKKIIPTDIAPVSQTIILKSNKTFTGTIASSKMIASTNPNGVLINLSGKWLVDKKDPSGNTIKYVLDGNPAAGAKAKLAWGNLFNPSLSLLTVSEWMPLLFKEDGLVADSCKVINPKKPTQTAVILGFDPIYSSVKLTTGTIVFNANKTTATTTMLVSGKAKVAVNTPALEGCKIAMSPKVWNKTLEKPVTKPFSFGVVSDAMVTVAP